MKNLRGFASDNNAGVHPEIMKAVEACNPGHVVGYGDDPYTRRAISKIVDTFGEGTHPYFVFNGTAANVVGLKSLIHSYHSVICADTAHIHEDECGAPEFITGGKVLPIHTPDGKLTIESIRPHIKGIDFEHHSQPRVISITQATELGTVYTPDEIRTLADFAHAQAMRALMSSPLAERKTEPCMVRPSCSSMITAIRSNITGSNPCSWLRRCGISPFSLTPC